MNTMLSEANSEVKTFTLAEHVGQAVKSYIKTYSITRRDKTEKMLGKLVLYFPLFEKYLMENGMPSDIKYLSVVESALNPVAPTESCEPVASNVAVMKLPDNFPLISP